MKRMKPLLKWILALIVVGGLTYGGYRLFVGQAAESEVDTFSEVTTVTRGDITASVSVTGEVVVTQRASLTFDVNKTELIELLVSAGQMVEHADLFQDPPRFIEWQHHAHRAQAQPRRALRQRSDQQVRRRAIRQPQKMMLAEENPFEFKPLELFPKRHVRRENIRRHIRQSSGIRGSGNMHELKKPSLDHRISKKFHSPTIASGAEPADQNICRSYPERPLEYRVYQSANSKSETGRVARKERRARH